MLDKDNRVMVAIAAPMPGVVQVPTVVLALPQGAIDAMQGQRTQTVDLTKVGLPVQIILFRGADHDDCVRILAEAATFVGGNTDRNLGIGEPTKQ